MPIQTDKNLNKVFISYASEDYNSAKKIYDFLSCTNYEPWLDKEKLLPGQDWDLEIKENLSTADFIIFLISTTSLSKRGYIQKEYKLARSLMEYKLNNDIYIVPVTLEDKLTDINFKHIQHIFIDDVYFEKKILDSLNLQRRKYFQENHQINSINDTYINQENRYKFNIHDFKIDFLCEFPEFIDNHFFDANEINNVIQGKIVEEIFEYRNFVLEDPEYFESEVMKSLSFDLQIIGNISFISNNIISICISISSYFGGVHPNTYIKSINFQISPLRTLKFHNLFKDYRSWEETLILLKKYNTFEDLTKYFQYINEENIIFFITEDFLLIELANFVPRVILAEARIEIPIKEIDLQVK